MTLPPLPRAAPAPRWLKPHGPKWSCGAPTRVHDNPWFAVDRYDAVAPTGARADYFLHDQKARAGGVVPLHADGTVTLVGQWRFPFGTYSWEIPEGGIPRDEEILAGIQRELAEEAGLVAADWREILRMQISNSSSNEVAFGFLATGLARIAHENPDDTESLSVVQAPFGEALQAAVDGHIQDAITVAMLLRVHHMAVTGDLEPDLARAVLG